MAQALIVQRRIVDGPLVAGIFVLRILFGVVYLTNGLAKVVPAGRHTSAERAELFSVARSTVYHAVQRARRTDISASAGHAPAGLAYISPPILLTGQGRDRTGATGPTS